jgi:hypothetical protein
MNTNVRFAAYPRGLFVFVFMTHIWVTNIESSLSLFGIGSRAF